MNANTWYKKVHKDYKGRINGQKYITVYDEKKGTIAIPMDSFVAGKYSVGVL